MGLAWIAHHLLVGLADYKVEHVAFGCGILVLEDFQKAIATLGADTLQSRVVGALGDAHWGAIIIMANTDTFQVLRVEDVMLVTSTTTCLWFAERALFATAGAGICLGIDDGKKLVARLEGACCT